MQTLRSKEQALCPVSPEHVFQMHAGGATLTKTARLLASMMATEPSLRTCRLQGAVPVVAAQCRMTVPLLSVMYTAQPCHATGHTVSARHQRCTGVPKPHNTAAGRTGGELIQSASRTCRYTVCKTPYTAAGCRHAQAKPIAAHMAAAHLRVKQGAMHIHKHNTKGRASTVTFRVKGALLEMPYDPLFHTADAGLPPIWMYAVARYTTRLPSPARVAHHVFAN